MLKTKECTGLATAVLLVCSAAAIDVYSAARGYADSPEVSLAENGGPAAAHLGLVAAFSELDPTPSTNEIGTFAPMSGGSIANLPSTPDENPTADPRRIGALY